MSTSPRYSIIAAVRNQYAVNELFLEYLKKYSKLPHELIIIDNASTDGSAELFERSGAKVIRNTENYSYPYCQNQGIRAATTDYFFFLNNDLLVSKDWDERSLSIIKAKSLEVFSWATTDRVENELATKKIKRRWKRIKYFFSYLMGLNRRSLSWMTRLMYGDWESYTESRHDQFGSKLIENFSGSAVGMTRAAFNKLGYWDERIQGADFDLYLRVKERQKKNNDIAPLKLMLGVYLHHFQRLTINKSEFLPFKDRDNIISIEKKWDKEFIKAALQELIV
ncbi:MAG: glycosyltransferase [Bdellovibrionota bacterium]